MVVKEAVLPRRQLGNFLEFNVGVGNRGDMGFVPAPSGRGRLRYVTNWRMTRLGQ